MTTIYERNIVRTQKLSSLPAFREPENAIAGKDFSRVPNDSVEGNKLECAVPERETVEIGVPQDLKIENERVIKKGTGTFIDVRVSFIPADGAEYHQFRVAKITEDFDGEE
jgi:hypothetical protein